MKLPKFIRKEILKLIGLEYPITASNSHIPFPRDAFSGFRKEEIDEIVLGSSYKRIEELRAYILENSEMIFVRKEQKTPFENLVNRAFDTFRSEEAETRRL